MNRPKSFLAVVFVAIAACGGNVVVDAPSTGTSTSTALGGSVGQGGAVSNGGTSAQGGGTVMTGPGGTGGATCSNLPALNTLMQCGGTATAGSSGAPMCDTFFCASGSSMWGASCQGDSCDCTLNNVTVCTCTLAGSCSAGAQCCFH